jgi:hypothetical protein
MAQKTDLYSILHSYSRKIASPSIDVEEFIGFLERYAKQICEDRPEWNRWTVGTSAKMWQELAALEEDNRVYVEDRDHSPKIVLPAYYTELVQDAYNNADYDISFPFPDEKSIKTKIPEDQCVTLGTSDIAAHLRQEDESMRPIVRLLFPNSSGEAVALASWLPVKILEICLAKVRNYMLRQNNKDYLHHKLIPQFTGKEELLKDFLNQLMMRPTECINDMKEGREISFYFWAFFCTLIRLELDKNDLSPEEQSVLQAVYIIEALNSFFKTQAAKSKETDLALKNLEVELDKPPYYFTREAIEKFTNSRGIPLLGQYSKNDLDAYIKKHTLEAGPEELPELLYIHADHMSFLIKKTRVLPLFARLLGEARPVVIQSIHKRWKSILLNWTHEESMESDREFERLILYYAKSFSPLLTSLLKDHRLFLICEEIKRNEKHLLESSRFFEGSELLPMRILLFIRQKDIISEIRLGLPVWYTLPFISSLLAFFHNMGKEKKPPLKDRKSVSPKVYVKNEDIKRKLRNSALEAESQLIPSGSSLDLYLDKLAVRWTKLLNKQAMRNLVEDVNTLVRDKLRHMLHFQKITNVKGNTLDMIANSIMQTSPELHKISEQETLTLYIKLYVIKLLTERILF